MLGYLILFAIGIVLLIESVVGLPGSLLAAAIVPGNMVEGKVPIQSLVPTA